jgi:hypothetical protein
MEYTLELLSDFFCEFLLDQQLNENTNDSAKKQKKLYESDWVF